MSVQEQWTNVMVDSQVLSTFMACPRKMYYVFNRHLIPIAGPSKSILKGQLAHVGYHTYNKAIIDGVANRKNAIPFAIAACKKEGLKFNLEPDDKLEVYATLEDFLVYQLNNSWMPVAAEKVFKFIAYEDASILLRIILTGRIDLIERDPRHNSLHPIDLKSEAEQWFYSALSNQFKIYALALQSPFTIVRRMGFQKTLKPEKKYKDETINFDSSYLEEFKNEILPFYCKQLLVAMHDNYYPPNYSSCITGHFGCQFSDKYNGGVCNLPPNLREAKLQRYFMIGEEWSPENDV